MNQLKKVLLVSEINGLPNGDPGSETNAQAAVAMPSSYENNINAIAITGIAFRFPGDLADDTSLWEALKQKKDLVTQVPGDRWASNELQHAKRSEPGRSITFSAGVLSRIDEFDAGFFGISPREAAWLDPQQRLLLELSWEAMENAGVPPSKLSGTDCAVYVGISSLDYGTRGLDDLAAMSSHSMTGNTLSIAANRLSYVFDLHGPSLAVDTACSSSLVALHHACRVLQTGEASTALVGGVNLLLHPYPFVGFTKASMLSADGRCKAFDASGNGYVRAEGGAVLLLKPLAQAMAAGDDIKAVILATGVNADGARKTGITIPSRDGQAELMRNVLAKTNLSAQDIDFVEAHGTGTMVGDPIETAAIGAVYGQGRKAPLPIGSVKANLGHMEAASGMAGLVKAILALQRRALPPQLHLETPNPNIDFVGLNLQPITEYQPLEKETSLVAGVNSFGFGGANAHVLLREYRHDEEKAYTPEALPPLFLSARSDAALQTLASRHAERLKNSSPTDYYDIAHAAAHRRDRLDKRLALHANTPDEAVEKLAEYAQGGAPDGLVLEEHLPQSGGVAFVYSGNGAQWVGMGLRLMAESPAFADILAELDARMQPIAGFLLLAELQASGEASRIDDTVVAQPLLFAIQVVITRLLKTQGIEPQAVAGHSVGEVAAAWACGALDLDAAIRVIVARSRAQGETRGTGRMAAVGLSVEAMQAVMAELGDALDITIAGINSPKNLTLSGSLADLERVQSHLATKSVFFRLLDLDYAFHSRQMDPIRVPLLASLAGLETRAAAEIAFVSTVTGVALDANQLGAEYWWRNVREPVRFSDAIATLSGLGCRSFIEIGPHAILQRYIGECLISIGTKGRVLPTLRKEADGWNHIVETALRAHLLAEQPNLGVYFPQPGRRVQLPNYPWQRERHWHPRTSESLFSIERRRVHPLLGWRIPEAAHIWENTLDPAVLSWLVDHQVGGAIVFPGAAYAEMALAAAREWLGGESLAFEEMDIVSPMVFDGEHARTLRFELNDRDGSFQIKSRQRLSHDEWTLHAAGRILQPGAGYRSARIPPLSGGADRIDRETHYRLAATLALNYGPTFQGLREAVVADNCLQADLEYHADLAGDDYLVHPALLDVCYQSLVDFFRTNIDAGLGVALLPVKTGRLEYHRAGTLNRFRARLIRRSARSVLADFELFDAEDQLLASVSSCRFRAAPLAHKAQEKVSRWRINAWLHPHPAEGLKTQLPSTQALVETLSLAMAEQAEPRGHWFKEALPLFEALVVSFTFEAFWTIAREGDDALQGLMTTSDPYARWLSSLLRQEGLLSFQDRRWQLADSSDLPAAEDIWRTLVREHDAALPHLVLLGRVGRHLPYLLQNPSERGEFIKALRRSTVAETFYQDDPAYAGMRQAVEHLLRHLASDWPTHRRLRVLEITDGPSEVPRALLAALPEDRLDYVLALPETVAQRQQAEYAHEPNLVIATLDYANWQLTAETRLPDKFDVVILRHTLHRAVSPKVALNQARRWLAANASLIIAERHPDWSADFLAGLDNDWWHEATGGEAPDSSLATATAWAELLRAEGFEDVLDYFEAAADGLSEGAYLLLARAPAQWAVALPVPEPASWLFLADAASLELAEHLAARLESQGQRVATVQDLSPNLTGIDHVVHLRGWNGTPETATTLLAEALGNVQALAAHPAKTPRLWLVTRGGALASNLPATVEPNPQQAALWGFARVVMNEYPALECTLIDLRCEDGLDRLENELLYPDGASEILLTDTGRCTLVMQEASEDQSPHAAPGERFRLDFHLPGQLRNLIWLPQEKAALADDTVEVEVRATGLNFRDVMYLMGLLPDEAVEKGYAGASLGLEFAGIVSCVGPRVRDFRPGDKVMGFGSACFASHVVTRADAVARMPEEWSFESAATVPTVFFTVYYALKHLADLQAGERVLIHGGAGGVGIAAIQLAKYLGAEVFATAGGEEKRDFVRLLGADHVFDSRSLAFADDILAATNGEGVDVVLNSLAGEAIRRNLSVLKPFGRFLELGKRDFFENTPIGLRPFKDNISYFGIDADQLLTGRPQLAARMFREVMALFREGALTPLPCRVFSAERVVDAFRTMQQARHIGKVVVSLADARPVVEWPATAPVPLQLTKDSTWIVTGGLSGFGLESARWLAAHGVGHLVLVGRRGLDTPGAREAVDELTAKGIQVLALACDISDAAAVVHMVEHARKTCPPIQGVLHAAAVFDDALLQKLDASRMETVIAPKLLGAWNLHQATLDVPLEHFVLYSSITTAIGNPGQANYVAANAGLEGLAEMRRHIGLPAVCVGWGPIGDAGYLTRNEAVRDSLGQRLGKPPLRTLQALDELDDLLPHGSSLAVANFDWNTLARLLPSATRGRFAALNRSLKSTGLSENEADFKTLIAGKSPEEVAVIVQQWVVIEVAQILAIGADRIDPTCSLHDLGLDSLMAVELALGLEQRFGIQLPVMMLNESPTAEKVTQRIVEKLLGSSDQTDAAANTVDAMVQGITQQHGEALAAEDIQQITQDARALQKQGTRLTA
ncbi:type I polyketide synthase [Laribacter hongkongensis]|uniref:type I polyketide synthase n=1 Tax=Laribacter hongkongensis TaxID=168471 RepID=UPI001EFCEEC0|nr:type I polyketide synthase [Laribacter hongkongensis]MCG9076298.1 SDR family NAD(P)-dependent oxidoreductase [Laribacter hongkongensis]